MKITIYCINIVSIPGCSSAQDIVLHSQLPDVELSLVRDELIHPSGYWPECRPGHQLVKNSRDYCRRKKCQGIYHVDKVPRWVTFVVPLLLHPDCTFIKTASKFRLWKSGGPARGSGTKWETRCLGGSFVGLEPLSTPGTKWAVGWFLRKKIGIPT